MKTCKNSGIKWIGNVPKHWEISKLKKHFIPRNQKVSDKDYAPLSVTKDGVLPQLDTACKTENGENRKLVCKGDYVVNSRSDRKGSGGVSPYDGSVSLINIVIEPTDGERAYYHYLFRCNNFVEEFYRNGRGIVSDLWTTRYQEMRNIDIPIPPLAEQRAIVSYLDGKVGQIDTYVAKQTQQIELLKELKQAVIANAVTKGMANYNNHHTKLKQSGISWIGEIPEHWEVRLLSQMATLHYLSNKDVHHQNLLSLSYGRIISKDINGASGLLPASYDTYQIVEDGNIVLRLTDLQNDQKSLRVGLCTQEGIITSAYLALQPRVTVLPAFLYLLLHAADIMKVFYSMGNGLRQNLNWGELRKLSCVLPPLPEQRAIVSYIEAQTANIDKLIDAYQQQVERVKEYKQRLISDAVTGKMNVTDEQTQTN